MSEKHFDHKRLEKLLYEEWQKLESFKVRGSGKPYTVLMPPPNVTGTLHLGHALTFTLQDILIRFHRLLGEDALWQPGTDHAGIATQMVVERELEREGLSRRAMRRDDFVKRVWQWKEKSGGAIVDQLKKLGACVDWSRERFTMDEKASLLVTQAFVRLYKAGLIYRDKRLVNWDTHYQTALSDIEVENREVKGNFYYLRYRLVDGTGHVTVATSRPETCFADQAIAVHPQDERYKPYVGKKVLVPLLDREIPLIADAYCDPEKGTGAVKITPAHDFNDFEVGKRHGLTLLNILTPDGRLNENVPQKYRGLSCQEARQVCVEDLEQGGHLEKIEAVVQAVPHGDRSGVVVEPYLTDQWYVDAPKLAAEARAAVQEKRTFLIPEQWEKVFFDWMNNIQPWCISRQIWWGHQIPVWYGPDGLVFVSETEEEAYDQARSYYGNAHISLKRDEDVLDTWFSSSLWPLSTLGWEQDASFFHRHYPTDVLVTGFDILFFWVARMMMMGLHFTGEVPFKNVYLHPLVLDAKGQKMSKSKGNVIDPLAMIEAYGADALRFSLAYLAAPGRDLRFSKENVEFSRNFMTKFWNALRYAQMNSCGVETAFDPDSVTLSLNQWIVWELSRLVEGVTDSLEKYRFHEAARGLYDFFRGTFCDWYLEFSKPILQTGSKEELEETRATLAWVLCQFCLLLHPFCPFITEALAMELGFSGAHDLLIHKRWPTPLGQGFEKAQRDVRWLISFISALRSFRTDLHISQAYLLEINMRDLSAEDKKRVDLYHPLLLRMGRLKEVKFEGRQSRQAVRMIHQEQIIDVKVEGAINVDHEIRRLTQRLSMVEKELSKTQSKLENQEFMKGAPEAIRAEMERRQQAFLGEKKRTEEILQELTSLGG